MNRLIAILITLAAILTLFALAYCDWAFDAFHKYPYLCRDLSVLSMILIITSGMARIEQKRRRDPEAKVQVCGKNLVLNLFIGTCIIFAILIPFDLAFGFGQSYPSLHSWFMIFILFFFGVTGIVTALQKS